MRATQLASVRKLKGTGKVAEYETIASSLAIATERISWSL